MFEFFSFANVFLKRFPSLLFKNDFSPYPRRSRRVRFTRKPPPVPPLFPPHHNASAATVCTTTVAVTPSTAACRYYNICTSNSVHNIIVAVAPAVPRTCAITVFVHGVCIFAPFAASTAGTTGCNIREACVDRVSQ